MMHLWTKIITRIKNSDVITWTVLFSLLYIAAWFANGFFATKFNCGDLMTWYVAIVVKEVGLHGFNSVYNSPKGEMPLQDKCPPKTQDR